MLSSTEWSRYEWYSYKPTKGAEMITGMDWKDSSSQSRRPDELSAISTYLYERLLPTLGCNVAVCGYLHGFLCFLNTAWHAALWFCTTKEHLIARLSIDFRCLTQVLVHALICAG